jgi:polygalacturonase
LSCRNYRILGLVIVALAGVYRAACAAPSHSMGPDVYSVRDFGAKGDGNTLDTTAIASAIRSASDAGGGEVVFPPGVYVTGTVELLSNVTLNLEPGAVLEGSKDLADYGSTEAFGFGRIYGVNSTGEGFKVGILVGRNIENVSIIGRGMIDGNADAFFDFTKPYFSMDFDPKYTRQGQDFMQAVLRTEDGPVAVKPAGRAGTMIICSNCRNLLMRDVTLQNAPNWTVHFNNTQGAVVTGIHIRNNLLIPNNDGFDCFGCKDVHFSDCGIQAGDDDFAILNSTDVTVANCSLTSRSSGIRVEATRDSTFGNLMIHANRGIGIYGRGIGITEHLIFWDASP